MQIENKSAKQHHDVFNSKVKGVIHIVTWVQITSLSLSFPPFLVLLKESKTI